MGIKGAFEDICKKHKLPSFDSLNNEFEINTIEESEFLLREIRRKIDDKIENFLKILEAILQPDTVLCDMHECRLFNDTEKKKIYDLYKKLRFFDRYSIQIAIDEDDKKTCEFVNDVMKDWNKVKEEMLWISKMLKESWLKDSDIKEELGYMG